MRDYTQIIKNVSFFSALKDDEIRLVSRIATVSRYSKNHIVMEEGEVRGALFIILNGRVKVSLFDDSGREYIVDTMEEGGFFGELSLFDELTGFINVITTEDSELMIIKRQDFIRLLMENPSFTLSVLKTLTRKLRSANEKLKVLAFSNVEDRIMQHLFDVAKRKGIKVKDRVIIERGPTQIEIANSIGCSRETVSRMIKSLVSKGKISVMHKQYTLRPTYT